MTKTIYTVIIGKGYKLREPEKVCPGWSYVCYTDQNIKSNVWKIKKYEKNIDIGNNRQNSRFLKIISCYSDVSIYIDAKFKPINNLDRFVERYLDEYVDMVLLKHNKRNCLYKEAKFVSNNGIEKWGNLQCQLKRYLKEGMPKNYGLWAPGIMIRKYSKLMDAFNQFWWNEYINGTERDQISLAYSLWKFPGLNINVMPFRTTYKRFRNV